MIKNQRRYLLLMLFCVAIIVGCQTTTAIYKGARAGQETVAVLQDAVKGQQHWQDLYVSVDYTLRQQGSQLVAEGVFTFSDYPQMNLAIVDDFKLKLFLLNQENIVLDYLDLYRTLGNALDEKMPFKKTLEISPDVVAVSFGYEGEFVDEAGSREAVWKLPRRSY